MGCNMESKCSTLSDSSVYETEKFEKKGFVSGFVGLFERILKKPLTRASKKKLAMSATKRESFVWTISREQKPAEAEVPKLFVLVKEDVPPADIIDIAVPAVMETLVIPEYPKAVLETADIFEFGTFSEVQTAVTSGTEVIDRPVYSECNLDSWMLEEADTVTAEEDPAETEFMTELYEDIEARAVFEAMETLVPEEFESPEEKAFYADLYDDIAAHAVMDVMEALVPEVFRSAPEYVISEISENAVMETVIEVPAEPKVEYVRPVRGEAITKFMFGFGTPAVSAAGPVSFRFTVGEESSDDEEEDSVRITVHSTGSEAVSASSLSGGSVYL